MTPESLLAAAVAPFPEVDAEKLGTLVGAMRPVRYAPGRALFREGEVCREIVLIGEGLVRSYYVHEHREVNLRFLAAPNVATAMQSLITGEPANEWVEAVTEVRGYRAEIQTDPTQRDRTEERLARILAEQHYLSMDRRLRMLQSKSGRERYQMFRAVMDPRIVRGMPGYHVASYLGLAPETLSRVRAQLGGSTD